MLKPQQHFAINIQRKRLMPTNRWVYIYTSTQQQSFYKLYCLSAVCYFKDLLTRKFFSFLIPFNSIVIIRYNNKIITWKRSLFDFQQKVYKQSDYIYIHRTLNLNSVLHRLTRIRRIEETISGLLLGLWISFVPIYYKGEQNIANVPCL